MGIADLITMAMEKEGLDKEQCLKKIWMVDSKGLIVKVRYENTTWRIFKRLMPNDNNLEVKYCRWVFLSCFDIRATSTKIKNTY